MSSLDDAWMLLRGPRILLVEDDPLIRLDLEASLSELGATVMTAGDISSALKILENVTVDFAVLDFHLGTETSEPIADAATARNVPFVYLSGYSEHDERFTRWPGSTVLAKPISVQAIARHIREVLGHHS